MWENLDKPWQKALEMAWEAYSRGTIPIGCVIVNKQGEIISKGRNRIFDVKSSNPLAGCNMAHAEMTAMLGLSEADHPEMKSYSIYTTVEPCPMCFGTMVMMNMRNIFYGAKDTVAGATELNDKLGYIKSKNIKVHHYGKDIEAFQLILSTAFECERCHPRVEEIVGAWELVNRAAVEFGRELYEDNYFKKAVENKRSLEEIYDEVLQVYYVKS